MTQGTAQRSAPFPVMAHLSLRAFGAGIRIETNDAGLLDDLRPYLPPRWEPAEPSVAAETLELQVTSGTYSLARGTESVLTTSDRNQALLALASEIHLQVAIQAETALFVHAGVVGWRGRAIVIPGRSLSGKSTLVAALVAAGATYYSDEYALFDGAGMVQSYPRPLSLRVGAGRVRHIDVRAGSDPLPLGLVAHLRYERDAGWKVEERTPGQAMLALLDNTVVAQLRPAVAMATLACAVAGTRAIHGVRGEAHEAACRLLELAGS